MMTDAVLNMDRTARVVIETAGLDWEASPAPGVWRKKLEREAAESGQVTSIVRYDSGSQFDAHLHPLGEEILVLEGVFEDEHGRYPPGSYLRNPPGSSHAPGSGEGCVLLVKLNMIDAEDGETVRLDTRAADWEASRFEGLWIKPLHEFGEERVALVRFDPGVSVPFHDHPRGEEIFVLDGDVQDEHGEYPCGSWGSTAARQRAPAGQHGRVPALR